MPGFRPLAHWALFATLSGVLSCKKQPTQPDDPFDGVTATPATLLSIGGPTKDEDPSVLLAADGTLYVAWFSDRSGNPDIYLTSSKDRVTWSAPLRITTGPHGDFYPNLLQDSHGVLHLVWFQWVAPFLGQIRHASSSNGTTWTPEEPVTTEFLSDDWVPTVAEAPDGSLLVYFIAAKRPGNSTNQIFLAVKRPNRVAWDPPVSLSINSPTEHDHLPFVARTGPAELTLAWVRYSAADSDFISNPRSDLYTAQSADGAIWSAPVRLTTDGLGQNLFPQIYRRHDGTWWILWLSTKGGTQAQYELPLADAARYPAGLVKNRLLPAGYSHRLAATPAPGEYLAAWVQGATGVEDIYYRLLTFPAGR